METSTLKPTPDTDVPETEPIVDDYAQTSTSADVLLQDCPQTPTEEPTPATDSSPRDGPVKINPGSFDSLYEVGKKLSSKPHGIVHEGIRRSDGEHVLIKFVKECQFDFQIGDSRPLCREAAIMRMVEHSDHVVKLYEWFDVEEHDILIMEHPGTAITLCDFIGRKGVHLAEAEAKDIMQQLVATLKYCSEQGVYHKHISLKAVLINSYTMQIKLTSFFKALSLTEKPIEGSFRRPVRALKRSHALMATNEALYRMLKWMVRGELLSCKNTSLSKECLDLLQKLHDDESGIIFSDILAHDWFKTPDTTDGMRDDCDWSDDSEEQERTSSSLQQYIRSTAGLE